MLTVVAYWDSAQLPHDLEWRVWRQLRGAYGVDRFCFVPAVEGIAVDCFDDMPTAVEATRGVKVFLEPRGSQRLVDVPKGDIVLVLGSTAHSNYALADPSRGDMLVGLPTKRPTDLYGVSAGAIAIAELWNLGKLA